MHEPARDPFRWSLHDWPAQADNLAIKPLWECATGHIAYGCHRALTLVFCSEYRISDRYSCPSSPLSLCETFRGLHLDLDSLDGVEHSDREMFFLVSIDQHGKNFQFIILRCARLCLENCVDSLAGCFVVLFRTYRSDFHLSYPLSEAFYGSCIHLVTIFNYSMCGTSPVPRRGIAVRPYIWPA